MMKKIKTLGIAAFFVVCFACDKELLIIDIDSSEVSYKQGLLFYKNVLFTGTAITYYSEKSVKSIYTNCDGKLNGKQLKYYLSGDLYSERFYSNGLKIGLHRGWWENRNLKFEFYFNDKGQHHGASNDYFEDGTPYKLFHYKFGKEEGGQKMFKPNGSLRANYVVVQGERFGLIGLKKCDAVSTM